MHRKFFLIASISGFICVLLGAFGAHTLKKIINADQLTAFETGVRYQFYHTIALIVISLLLLFKGANIYLKRAGFFFITGIFFFSGSLYLLSLRNLIGIELAWLGPVTPFGGLCFLFGWFMLLIFSIRIKF